MRNSKAKKLRKRFKKLAQDANIRYKFEDGLPCRNQYQRMWRAYKKIECT